MCILIDRGRSQFHIPVLSQEGANINKSLTTLGKVISALADLVSPEGWEEKSLRKRRLGLTHSDYCPLLSLSNQRSGSRISSLIETLCLPGCSRRIWVRSAFHSLPTLPSSHLTESFATFRIYNVVGVVPPFLPPCYKEVTYADVMATHC